jgi:hypothetical protein
VGKTAGKNNKKVAWGRKGKLSEEPSRESMHLDLLFHPVLRILQEDIDARDEVTLMNC